MPQPVGRMRACTECRLQKLKCDARLDYSKPCSRCRKMGLECEISRGVQKIQRKRKADLARENAKLRQQLHNEADAPSGDEIQPLSTTNNTRDFSKDIDECQRLIDEVGSDTIKECFCLFFTNYEPFLSGILDAQKTLQQYFDESRFLYWSIIATGARKRIVLPRIVKHIHKHADRIESLGNPFAVIKAVLILVQWPTLSKDVLHRLIGVAMQLAIQNGLHVFGHEQDFGSDGDKLIRSRLWAHCSIIFQIANLCDGYPFWMLPSVDDYDIAYQLTLPNSMLYRFKLHRNQMTAMKALHMGGPQLNSLVSLFDNHILVECVPNGDYESLLQLCVRLSIKAFHFLASSDIQQKTGLVQLYGIACQVLESAEDDTHFVASMVLLAAHIVLRISRSMNVEGEEVYLKAIKYFNERSTEEDLKTSRILTQLWESNIFRNCGGNPLRVRSRLFMSVVFDTFNHWRDVFGSELGSPPQSQAETLAANWNWRDSMPDEWCMPFS